MHRIAIIEDDPPTSNMFRAWLAEAYPLATLEQFFDLESGVRAVESRVFDLVISDIDLGRTTEKYGGVRIAGMLKGKPIPVLIVSGLPAPDLYREIMFALDAWDYLEKPVTQPDFLNQVGHALRWRESQTKQVGHQRMSSDGTTTVVDPLLAIDPLNRVRVAWRGSRVALSMTQVRIVDMLSKNRNQVLGYDQLYSVLDSGKNKANLRVHIQAIRNAFADVDPEFSRIHNVPMVGYVWRV